MKKRVYMFAVFSFLTGTGVYFAQKNNCKLPKIIQFYLNDFLIIPIILTTSLVVLRWSKNNKNYQIPFWIVLYICGLYGFLYEHILPKFHPRYTADIVDVLLYFIGGILFFILQKSKEKYVAK